MEKRSSSIILAFLNLIALAATVTVNTLSVMLPINGMDPGEISDQYPNLFVPAGITFSVWGVIYVLLGIFVVYSLVKAFKRPSGDEEFIGKIGILFFLSSLFNICWIFAWHYGLVLTSLIIMLALFITLIIIYLRLGIGRSQAGILEKSMVHVPFSVYLGWITIATLANLTAFLVYIDWGGFGLSDQFWAVLAAAVGIVICLVVGFFRNDIYYGLVIDWAILGILLKRLADPATDAMAVKITAIIGISLITLGILAQLLRKKIIY